MSLITLGACDLCSGVGTLPHSSPGETYSCGTCNGHGVAKRGGYGGYKTPATAARALANGNGRTCSYCDGTGVLTYPLTVNCYRCTDGVVVTSALPGQAWPEDAARQVRYQTGRGDGMAAYAAAVKIVVKGQNREGTWNEAYLGLGSIVSVTDYGRVWDAMVAAAKADTLDTEVERVRELGRKALLDGTQWVKLTRDDGTLAEGIAVIVHRSGYSVIAANVTERVSLPPTYTPEVLNAPVR